MIAECCLCPFIFDGKLGDPTPPHPVHWAGDPPEDYEHAPGVNDCPGAGRRSVCHNCHGDGAIYRDAYSPTIGHHTVDDPCPVCNKDEIDADEQRRYEGDD